MPKETLRNDQANLTRFLLKTGQGGAGIIWEQEEDRNLMKCG